MAVVLLNKKNKEISFTKKFIGRKSFYKKDKVLSVQEVLTHLFSKLLFELVQDYMDIQ